MEVLIKLRSVIAYLRRVSLTPHTSPVCTITGTICLEAPPWFILIYLFQIIVYKRIDLILKCLLLGCLCLHLPFNLELEGKADVAVQRRLVEILSSGQVRLLDEYGLVDELPLLDVDHVL